MKTLKLGFTSLLLALFASLAMAANVADTYHTDHRSSYTKLAFVHNAPTAAGLSDEAKALQYLEQHHQQFGLPAGVDNLVLTSVRHSLLGSHLTFQQLLAGHKVQGGTIVVSISADQGEVFQVYNNTYPVNTQKRLQADVAFDDEEALDISWDHLRVHGPLLLKPSSDLVYLPEGEGFHLVYQTEVGTEAPFGYWGLTIDAASGEVLDTKITSLTRKDMSASFDDYTGPVWDRLQATAAFAAQETAKQAQQNNLAVNGSGKVFDPDPVTTLQNSSLTDTSAESNFTAAYFTRTLSEIDLTSGVYRLTGPWVQIASFESPNTAPTTTTTGNWTGVRGNQMLNDAMTYFHIDQSQRYMQSLGFVGSTGIQYGSIQADADGLSGADNSHFIPSSNRIAFGKGCVDDNEDSFVILHEYGHAIQSSINSNWSGGDTGGMGEGFGDYWAGSYKYSTPNGPNFQPNWAFSWDGHNGCWSGRLMNNNGQYDASKTYGAHTTVNGVSSDELWSSPLFQSLVRLTTDYGVAREDVDQIVLQAHFGIGSAPKMRDMATAVVNTATALFPSGPHTTVLREEFEARGILLGGGGGGGGTTSTFTGTVAKSSTSNQNLTVSAGTISLSLTWNNSTNLDLNLYNPSGTKVATSATRNTPEALTYNATAAGTYRIEIVNKNKKNSANWTVTANYTP